MTIAQYLMAGKYKLTTKGFLPRDLIASIAGKSVGRTAARHTVGQQGKGSLWPYTETMSALQPLVQVR